MKIAFVAATEAEARTLIARLGMVQAATPLRAGTSALLGHRFTAVIIGPGVDPALLGHREWWETLSHRLQQDSPTFRLEAL